MDPVERVHELIISGKVIGPDGSWISRTEALKEKRAFLQHVLSGEVNINGVWTHLSRIDSRTPSLPQPSPPRNEYEKETAVMPPEHFGREAPSEKKRMVGELSLPATPPPVPEAPRIVQTSPDFVVGKETAPGRSPVTEEPLFALPVGGTDNPPPFTDHKAIADSIFGRRHFLQPDASVPPVIPDDDIDPRNTVILPPVTRAPDTSAVPPQAHIRHSALTPVSAPPVTPDLPDNRAFKGSDDSVIPSFHAAAVQPPNITHSQNVPPLAKLDLAANLKKTGTAGLFDTDAATLRTAPLGKGASLAISESAAAGTKIALCSVEGFIDQSNSDMFNLQLMSMLESGVRYFIIDFEHTVLVGSAGWGTLAVAARMVKMSGGRLLICSMKPEIAESFRLLQFHDVIDALPQQHDCMTAVREAIERQHADATSSGRDGAPVSDGADSFADLPLHEKIRTVISRGGPLSLFQIAAQLRGDLYGNVKIGPLKLYFILKDLNLESHWKRVRYYRSC